MTVVFAIVIGILFASSIYLILRRSIVKLILGLSLLGQTANLLIFTVGGLSRGNLPLIAHGETALTPPYADPLPQALILTAIVIGFGIQAFALILVRVAYQTLQTEDLDMMREADQQ